MLWKDAARSNPTDPYKKYKRYKPHQDRVRETVTARGQHVRHERLQVSKKTSNRHERTERYQLMERQGSVKRRASVAGLRFTLWEWLLSGWRNTIICYHLGSGVLNSGTCTLKSAHAHIHTHTCIHIHIMQAACWFISLPKAGSAHSLYCSGVQYGAFPKDRQKNTMFTVWPKIRGEQGKRGFRGSTKGNESKTYN